MTYQIIQKENSINVTLGSGSKRPGFLNQLKLFLNIQKSVINSMPQFVVMTNQAQSFKYTLK